MIKAIGYAAKHSSSKLKPVSFEREAARSNEVEIEVLFCGVCHSDIHQAKDEWENTVYPCMPGHEVVGRVVSVGSQVTRHKKGDLVGVGCMIDSCGRCAPCLAGEENYCEGPNGWLATYNGPMIPAAQAPGRENTYGKDNTYGGYSNVIVVREDFVVKIPGSLAPEEAAPILCAGVTTFSPLKHFGVKAGSQVGVVGLGGLGHVAVKLALAMGAKVTVFTTSSEKVNDAEKLGAIGVLETDSAGMAKLKNSCDFILSTVPEKHKLDPFIACLKRDSTLVVVGQIGPLPSYDNQELVMHRKSLAGSVIGSIAETQAVLDFCAEHNVAPDIQVIPIQDVNRAYKSIEDGEARFRYVIDMASLKKDLEA